MSLSLLSESKRENPFSRAKLIEYLTGAFLDFLQEAFGELVGEIEAEYDSNKGIILIFLEELKPEGYLVDLPRDLFITLKILEKEDVIDRDTIVETKRTKNGTVIECKYGGLLLKIKTLLPSKFQARKK